MDPLPLEFVSKKRTYRQVRRTDKAAIYSVQTEGRARLAYEVFKIKISKEHTWPNGNTTPEHESYPGDNAFGKTAWYCMTLMRAEDKFEEIS